MLRRVYAEVGDGGFGPGGGLASLRRGRRASGHLEDWPCSVPERPWGPDIVPRSWFRITYGGCSIELQLSLIAVDYPVFVYDAEGWEPTWDRPGTTPCSRPGR
ncbi:hypothetical protein OG216_00290 [Streptomycetaceae bacterium NBC_01309]